MGKTMCDVRNFTKRLDGGVKVTIAVGDVEYDIYQMHKIQDEEATRVVLSAELPEPEGVE